MDTKDTIDTLRIIYDEVEEAPNNLIIAIKETNLLKNDINIISEDKIIYKMTCDSFEVTDRFIIGKVKVLNFQFVNAFDTLTKTSILSKLKGIAEDHSVREFSCSKGMIRVRVGDFVGTRWIIFNNKLVVINKEFYSIDNIESSDEYFYFTGYRSFRDQFSIFGEKRIKMNNQTGEIVSNKTINVIKHLRKALTPYKANEVRR